jgi:DNA-binding CsgD family transcriptional regulator
MPDILTASERAAIADAIAAGKINRIPAGVSATAVDYVWDGRGLVQADGGSKCWRKQPRIHFAKRKGTAERRQRICALTLQGWTQEAIARELGVSTKCVRSNVAELRKAELLPPPPPVKAWRQSQERQARQAKVAALRAEGKTQREVAAILGVKLNLVKSDCQEIAKWKDAA